MPTMAARSLNSLLMGVESQVLVRHALTTVTLLATEAINSVLPVVAGGVAVSPASDR
jgi:hypothetical protein